MTTIYLSPEYSLTDWAQSHLDEMTGPKAGLFSSQLLARVGSCAIPLFNAGDVVYNSAAACVKLSSAVIKVPLKVVPMGSNAAPISQDLYDVVLHVEKVASCVLEALFAIPLAVIYPRGNVLLHQVFVPPKKSSSWWSSWSPSQSSNAQRLGKALLVIGASAGVGYVGYRLFSSGDFSVTSLFQRIFPQEGPTLPEMSHKPVGTPPPPPPPSYPSKAAPTVKETFAGTSTSENSLGSNWDWQQLQAKAWEWKAWTQDHVSQAWAASAPYRQQARHTAKEFEQTHLQMLTPWLPKGISPFAVVAGGVAMVASMSLAGIASCFGRKGNAAPPPPPPPPGTPPPPPGAPPPPGTPPPGGQPTTPPLSPEEVQKQKFLKKAERAATVGNYYVITPHSVDTREALTRVLEAQNTTLQAQEGLEQETREAIKASMKAAIDQELQGKRGYPKPQEFYDKTKFLLTNELIKLIQIGNNHPTEHDKQARLTKGDEKQAFAHAVAKKFTEEEAALLQPFEDNKEEWIKFFFGPTASAGCLDALAQRLALRLSNTEQEPDRTKAKQPEEKTHKEQLINNELAKTLQSRNEKKKKPQPPKTSNASTPIKPTVPKRPDPTKKTTGQPKENG